MMVGMDAQTMADMARVAADDFRRGKESLIEVARDGAAQATS